MLCAQHQAHQRRTPSGNLGCGDAFNAFQSALPLREESAEGLPEDAPDLQIFANLFEMKRSYEQQPKNCRKQENLGSTRVKRMWKPGQMSRSLAIRDSARARYFETRTREETDMTSKLARIFLVFLLVFPIVRGQSVSPEASVAEKKKAREEREKKTLALVDEIIAGSQSLKLPENRIRVNIGLVGALWPRDEKRARSLFKEAVASLNEITTAIDNGDPEYINLAHLPQQLRQEMVQIAANHDARLAVDFLRATRIDSASRPPNSGMTNVEANLEMQVAMQIADKDPQEALSVAEDSLKITVDYGALNLLHSLQSRQKALAERFLEDVLNGIRTCGIGNSAATTIAINLLSTWIENNRTAKDPAAPRTTASLSLSNLNEETAREISNMIINALLSNGPAKTVVANGRAFIDGPSTLYPGQVQGMFQQLKPMLPDIERLAPDRMADLRARMVEFEKSYEARPEGAWAKYQELAQTGTSEALMEAAKTAPSEFVDNLVHQAAWKSINQGDDEKARQIIDKITDPRQRADMKSQLVRQAFYRANEQRKVSEARALALRLTSVEEQVVLLVQLAVSSAANGDKPLAFQLLGEAQALLPDRAASYGQLQAQMQIAGAYEDLDASKSTPIVEKVIDQVNELVSAALVLNGFDVQGYFRSGEFVITGGNPLNNMAQECGRALASGARNDLDRARSVAERFQRPEMRLIALLQIARAALTSDDSAR